MLMQSQTGLAKMKPKQGHLGLKYAEQFKDPCVVEVYHHRLPYADEVINKLITLLIDEPRVILDVGCGTGDLARRLVSQVERVDAVDFSSAMIDKGKTLPKGDNHNLNWIFGLVEEVELHPHTLITAGESLHWMEWDIVLPLFLRILTPRGHLALVTRETEDNPWDDHLQELINRFSTNQEFLPYDLVEELELRHLFQPHGFLVTQTIPMKQSGEDYVQSFHSRNGFSRKRMGEQAAMAFDEEIRKIISPFLQDGQLLLFTINTIVWGLPKRPIA